MPTLAFVTCTSLPDLTPDEQAVAALLAARGIPVVATVWDDPAVNWGDFEALVLRSTWDYHHRPAEFAAWLGRVEAAGVTLWNPPATVRWNMEKGYLRNLEAQGVAIAATEWLTAGQPADLTEILRQRGWMDAVVKPAISASAHNTWRVQPTEAAASQGRLQAALASGDILLQEFMAEIQSEGEWSLLFFGGQFSHAVLKRPAAGDFRVQNEYGGGHQAAQPAKNIVAQAAAALAAAPGPTLYARVDGVLRGETFVLMELELIEPYLFLSSAEGAVERFAAAVAEIVIS